MCRCRRRLTKSDRKMIIIVLIGFRSLFSRAREIQLVFQSSRWWWWQEKKSWFPTWNTKKIRAFYTQRFIHICNHKRLSDIHSHMQRLANEIIPRLRNPNPMQKQESKLLNDIKTWTKKCTHTFLRKKRRQNKIIHKTENGHQEPDFQSHFKNLGDNKKLIINRFHTESFIGNEFHSFCI